MDPVRDTLKRLQFTANNKLLCKAQGYYAASVRMYNMAALPLVCIHLACNTLNIPAPVSSIFQNLPISKDNYVSRYHEVSKHLNIPPSFITLEELGVVYGCQSIVSAATELKSIYELKCKESLNPTEFNRMLFDSLDINVSIFEAIAKALKVSFKYQL